MEAIEKLKNEHQLIQRALIVSQAMISVMTNKKSFVESDVRVLLDIIVNYADKFHHKKEEDVLFHWMEERGFPVEGGPIQCMLHEHDLGRSFIQKAAVALNHPDLAMNEKTEAVFQNLKDFVHLLEQHIYKEDHILYPMAERLALTGSDAEILSRYREKINEAESCETNERYEALVTSLEKKYL